MTITEYLTAETFHAFLVFCRVGSCFMLLPGFGDSYVSPRVRLVFALVLSLALFKAIPPLPPLGDAPGTLILVFHEVVIGLLLGGIIKLMTSAVHIAGSIVGAQSSLGQASLFDPSQQAQGAVFGTFMNLIALVMMFSLDFHHLMITGIVDSYQVFNPSAPLDFYDFSRLAVTTVSQSFMIGVQMGAPLIVIGIIINITSGILARLMPAFQVFFVIMPAQIMISLFIFMATLSSVMLIYIRYLNVSLESIFPLSQ